MVVKPFHVSGDPWIRAIIQVACETAVPNDGATYWDWRDQADDSFYTYVLELGGHVIYVGQTAKGARERIRQHEHPAANVRVVRKFGFVREICRVNVGSRNEALALEAEMRRQLQANNFMVSIGGQPRPNPSWQPIPGSPRQSPSKAEATQVTHSTIIDPDDYYVIALDFLWRRSQGADDGKGLALRYYKLTQTALATDIWDDPLRRKIWRALWHHRVQLTQCADLERQPIPPPPKPAAALHVSLQNGELVLSTRHLHPLLARVRRQGRKLREDVEAGTLRVPADEDLLSMIADGIEQGSVSPCEALVELLSGPESQ